MSHFSTMKTRIRDRQLLMDVLKKDFKLKPKDLGNLISVQGVQFNCRYTLRFELLNQDGTWNISGDLYYIDRSWLGGDKQNALACIMEHYSRRLLQQQLQQNGMGWDILEQKKNPQGETTFMVAGPSGEAVQATLGVDGKTFSVGVNNAGASCLDITQKLTEEYQLQEQTMTEEYQLQTEESYLYNR